MENNEIKNTIENNTVENNSTNQNENSSKPAEPQTDEEKAIDIVKKDWGADSSVNFVVDSVNENGEYIVCVRNRETTVAIEWYTVNVENGTFKTR